MIRTHGLSLRRGMHYPAMLREHLDYFIIIHYIYKFSIIIFFTLMYNKGRVGDFDDFKDKM